MKPRALTRFAAFAAAALLAGCEQAQPPEHRPPAVVAAPVTAAPLTLVENGQSPFVIYTDAAAPASVQAAAADLQAYIEKVSGAKLPLVNAPREPMLALGNTPTATQAGVNSDTMPLEGFRIAVRGRNLFVLGSSGDW